MEINSKEIKERIKKSANEKGFHSNFMKVIESIKDINSTTYYNKNADKKRESVSFDSKYIPIIIDIYNCYITKGKESLIGKLDDELLNNKNLSSYMSALKRAIPVLEKIYDIYNDKKDNFKYSVRDIIKNISDSTIYTNFKSTLIYSGIDIAIINKDTSKEEDVMFNDMDALIEFLVKFSNMSRDEQRECVKKMKQANNETDYSKLNYINRTIIHVLPILLDKYKIKEYNNGEQLKFKNDENNVLDEILNKICNIFKQLEVVKLDDNRFIIDGIILLTLDKKDKELKAFSRYDVILITDDFNYEDIFEKIIDRCFSYSGN